MSRNFAQVAFTPDVKALQQRHGSRAQYARREAGLAAGNDVLGPHEVEFIERADSFYMATVSETGWPYVQHRGGPVGFVRVPTPQQLAFADFRGNLQYISAGNAAGDDKVALIFMDLVHRRRLKLLGRLHFVDAADAGADLLRSVELPGYGARVERVATIDVVTFDWNCPQHITQRFTLHEVEAMARPLRERIAVLEARLRDATSSASAG